MKLDRALGQQLLNINRLLSRIVAELQSGQVSRNPAHMPRRSRFRFALLPADDKSRQNASEAFLHWERVFSLELDALDRGLTVDIQQVMGVLSEIHRPLFTLQYSDLPAPIRQICREALAAVSYLKYGIGLPEQPEKSA